MPINEYQSAVILDAEISLPIKHWDSLIDAAMNHYYDIRSKALHDALYELLRELDYSLLLLQLNDVPPEQD